MARKKKAEAAEEQRPQSEIEEAALVASVPASDVERPLVEQDSHTVARRGVEDPDPVVVWDDGSR